MGGRPIGVHFVDDTISQVDYSDHVADTADYVRQMIWKSGTFVSAYLKPNDISKAYGSITGVKATLK
jgi:hypothetical protein